MSEDIGGILESWPYKEGNNVRKIVGADGREKVQLRVVLEGYNGILQFECEGRADGKRPHGREYALDYYEDMAREEGQKAGYPGRFRLTSKQAGELFEESQVTYQRYVILMQMNDHRRVIRDTARNMRLFQFVHEHAQNEEDRERLEKWRPYILRIHYTSRALLKLEEGDAEGALVEAKEGRKKIEDLAEQEDETFRAEHTRSLAALDELEEAIRRQRPPTEMEALEREKTEAIQKEDYERAAELRDRIENLRKEGKKD